MPSDRPTEAEAIKLRDHIRFYGQDCNESEYLALKEFGQWFAEQADATDVVLSDWTPCKPRATTASGQLKDPVRVNRYSELIAVSHGHICGSGIKQTERKDVSANFINRRKSRHD